MAFQKATKKQAKGRMALCGPSGSGKTYTALRIAKALGDRVAVIDTERGSASKYADKFEFDTDQLTNFAPDNYIEKMNEVVAGGYDVLIIDSLSHAWEGTGGILEIADNVAKRMKTSNKFAAWKEATPIQNKFIGAILDMPCHVIVTMRSKTEYVVEENQKGKQAPRKVGMAPVQRAGVEYEFDVVADLDVEHNAVVSKSRCDALDEKVFHKAGENDLGKIFAEWLSDGAPAPVTQHDLEKLQTAIRTRCKALDLDPGDYLPICGKDVVRELGYERSADIPRDRMEDALASVAMWEPAPGAKGFEGGEAA